MPKRSRSSHPGFIKQLHNPGLIKNSPDIYSSKLQHPVTLSATTVRENPITSIWTSECSGLLLTKQQITDLVHSVSTSSVSLYSILKSSKLSATQNRRIKGILSSLRQTVRCLNDILTHLLVKELIK